LYAKRGRKSTAAVDLLDNDGGEPISREAVSRPKQKRKTKKSDADALYWVDEDEETTIQVSKEDSVPSMLRFMVRGNPLPLRRHRTSRGFMYNPSATAQASFRDVVKDILFSHLATDNDEDESVLLFPVLPEEHSLAMTIVFYLKRPLKHFVGSKPGPGRMRDSAPHQTSVTRMDVDNLAKFVLDSLNGLLYEDDRQVVSLHITKLYDNHDECKGSTEICVRRLGEESLPKLLENTFELF
jgi:Holliday junction resolvase RusA-like endonuclease